MSESELQRAIREQGQRNREERRRNELLVAGASRMLEAGGSPAPLAQVNRARDAIDPVVIVARVQGIADTLEAGYERVQDAVTGSELQVPLTRERASALKAAADLQIALLKKRMPDLAPASLDDLSEDDRRRAYRVLRLGFGFKDARDSG